MPARCPNTITHPEWINAIAGHVTGLLQFQVPEQGLPRLTANLRKRRLYYDSWITPLTNCGMPSAGLPPTENDALALVSAIDAPVLLQSVVLQHPVTQALLQAAPQARVLKRWHRAGLKLQGTFEDWLLGNFDQKRRKELKRLRARLEEQGSFEALRLASGGQIEPFLQAFLQLEQASWKGRRKTAIASDAATAKGLEAALSAMHACNKLKFWMFQVNGRPVAALFALVDDGEVLLGKIAHAENFAKFSPGVLIVVEATADLLRDGHHEWADSNAIPGHPMIDHIWRDRIECADVLLAGPLTPIPVFRLVAAWLGTKSALKQSAKHVLARVIRRKIS